MFNASRNGIRSTCFQVTRSNNCFIKRVCTRNFLSWSLWLEKVRNEKISNILPSPDVVVCYDFQISLHIIGHLFYLIPTVISASMMRSFLRAGSFHCTLRWDRALDGISCTTHHVLIVISFHLYDSASEIFSGGCVFWGKKVFLAKYHIDISIFGWKYLDSQIAMSHKNWWSSCTMRRAQSQRAQQSAPSSSMCPCCGDATQYGSR